MNESEVRATVQRWVQELAPRPEGWDRPNPVLVDDLDYHSLALLELAFALEDEFDLPPIDEGDAEAIRTLGDVEEYVVSQMRAGGRVPSPETAGS